ncbi:MAG: AAA family ATPase, partial [Chloroflexota bacterium]
VDENSNTEMGAILNELARIAHTTDTTILIVHHTNKSFNEDIFSTFRGASSIRGAYDVGFALERKQGEKEAKLYVESRDFESTNMTLRQINNGTGWEFVGAGEIIDRIRKGKRTLEALKDMNVNNDGVTAEMLASYRDVTVQSIHNDLDSLIEHGYVKRIERGSSRNGRIPNLFKLIEDGVVQDN